MGYDNIKRNSLDYILTDILPVELSEMFTFRAFYNFLFDNQKEVDEILKKMITNKNKVNSKLVLFKGNSWASIPLKYSIVKNQNSSRELNVMQPIAALQVYLFVSIYQKEILSILEQGSIYSLRCHTKAKELIYKKRRKNVTQYFNATSENLDRGILEQTGMFFDLKPYQSIVAFTSSDKWFDLNLKYKYFAKVDYQNCFGSIYTHTYKWLISRDVNDSINFDNTNIYTTIDRILQNINARTSNGVIVGPEFSRMIAEILLQGIDTAIYNNLLEQGSVYDENYVISRYVDDVFIFADSEELIEKIIAMYSSKAKEYLLTLNEMKIVKEKLPTILNYWLKQANQFSSELINSMFYNKDEIEQYEKAEEGRKGHLVKSGIFYRKKQILKRNFNDLICQYPDRDKTLVSYALGTILNKVFNAIKSDIKLFKEHVSRNTVYTFLDYIFYVFSFFPNFDNCQKVISIISYINDEYNLLQENREVMEKIIRKYSYVLKSTNINDIVNILLLCSQGRIEISSSDEEEILEKVRQEDNPVVWATFLLYSRYDDEYMSEIKGIINSLITEKLDAIRNKKNILTYREFWWLLIFNKSPYINVSNQQLFDTIIDESIMNPNNQLPSDKCANLVGNFLKNSDKQFFEWDIDNRELLKQITFRTYQRTIFKNYKYNVYNEFTSFN